MTGQHHNHPGNVMTQGIVVGASEFAYMCHKGQKRRYTGWTYYTHPLDVAFRVAEVFPDAKVVAAAFLHDVVEDTTATIHDILDQFGEDIARLVEDLTDVSRPQDGNRAARKAKDRLHTKLADPKAKLVKLADLIDNAESIFRHDPAFAPVYAEEMRALLKEALWIREDEDVTPKFKAAFQTLRTEAWGALNAWESRNGA